MSRLVQPSIDLQFQELMAIGRARLPALAPQWTDHNAHDPGITLMELLAWVAEAQLYAVGHPRRDERAAYIALLGLAATGTQPARGLIWPDLEDPRAPAATHAQSVVIPTDAIVNVVSAEMPTFRPAHKLLWVPGEIRNLVTRLANGRRFDHTAVNARQGPAFQPFSDAPGPRDVLAIDFECRGEGGVFPRQRMDAAHAFWAIGVRVSDPLVAQTGAHAGARSMPLSATVVTETDRYPVVTVSDSTDGLLRTGALLLDLSAVVQSPRRFSLELRAPRGLTRPPRVLQIAPNVMPVVQGRQIVREVHVVNAATDWSFQLEVPGLRFAPSESPVEMEVAAHDGHSIWQRVDRLATSGPADRVYTLDTATDRITFGNGINGRAPPTGAQVLVSYAVCDGAQGSVARNRKWRVQGFAEAFGVNLDSVTGGAGPDDWHAHRRESRRRARDEHALVSADDIARAALALPLLDVARAWVVPPDDRVPRTGIVTLVAMRGLRADEPVSRAPEMRHWREAIRRRLTARMSLGARLRVTGPRYVAFGVRATVESVARRSVDDVQRALMDALRARLATTGPVARRPGVPVSRSDVAGWLRAVDGVARVLSLRLVRDTGAQVQRIAVPPDGLPQLDATRSTVDVRRAGKGGVP